jgi:bifunctional DNA-binding transcriptional regulator/antitoxin component of YhaV-PrlF toxin-antitoxin module
MKRITFGTVKIQSLRRISLDPNLLANLGLCENDVLSIYLDLENEEIVLKRAQKAESGLDLQKGNGQRKRIGKR